MAPLLRPLHSFESPKITMQGRNGHYAHTLTTSTFVGARLPMSGTDTKHTNSPIHSLFFAAFADSLLRPKSPAISPELRRNWIKFRPLTAMVDPSIGFLSILVVLVQS
ncbi:hypothetical protein AKJ16_DCAP12213 [Drosera capensis]